jgi:hypothetical protein
LIKLAPEQKDQAPHHWFLDDSVMLLYSILNISISIILLNLNYNYKLICNH